MDKRPPPPDATAVIGQIMTFTSKLTSVLEDAEDIGGLRRVLRKVKPAVAARLTTELRMLSAELVSQLEDIDAAPARKASAGPIAED